MFKRIIGYIIIFVLFTIAVICGFFYYQEHQKSQEEIIEYTILNEQFVSMIHKPPDETITKPDDESDDEHISA